MKTIYIQNFRLSIEETLLSIKEMSPNKEFNLITGFAGGFVFNNLYSWRVRDVYDEDDGLILHRGFTIIPNILLKGVYAGGSAQGFYDLIETKEDLRSKSKSEILSLIGGEYVEIDDHIHSSEELKDILKNNLKLG